MYRSNSLETGQWCLDGHDRFMEIGLGQTLVNSREPVGTFRMTWRCDVVPATIVVNEQHGHCFEQYLPAWAIACVLVRSPRPTKPDRRRDRSTEMMTQDTIAAGGDRIRIGPHRGSDHTAMLVPVDVRGILNEQALAKSLDALRQRGYSLVVTWALGPAETRPFLAAGFETHHELHLMTRDLEQHPATTPVERGRLRAVRRTDWNQVLDVDRAAFDSFWQFDHDGIRNALKATPSRRLNLNYL